MSATSKIAFRMLAKFNQTFLPRLYKMDVNRLSRTDKVLIAYKYWIVLHALD